MKNIALVFPGQGSQYVGMGKEFYVPGSPVKAAMDKADEVLGFELSKIILDGPEDKLRQTQYTQPAIFALSVGIFNLLNSKNLLSDKKIVSAGHSLGNIRRFAAPVCSALKKGLNLSRRAESSFKKPPRQIPERWRR